MKKSFQILLISFVTSLLIACGGGSDSPAPSVSTPPPTGGTGGGTNSNDPVININIDNPTLSVFDNKTVTDTNNMTLVWSEEFDAEQLDPEVWFFEKGDGSQYGLTGWGNNELQWYLEDSALIEDGVLVITAKQESVGGKNYTSARLNTRDRVAFRYGRVEASIKFPAGQGYWPAFWMMPQDNTYGTWAASGEIDIVEAVNLGVNNIYEVHGTIHYGAEWPNNQFTGEAKSVNQDVATSFHTYAIEWDPEEIRWYVDDELYATQTEWATSSAAYPAPFDEPFYIILNVAVGGNWPGAPNSSTEFPSTMEVDYIRVYEGS